jgi:hypothetical protein
MANRSTANREHGSRANGQVRAHSSDVAAKLDLLVEAAVARGRVRSPETLRDLDQAAIEYYKISKAWTLEREHQLGVCHELSCPLCERARERDCERETEEVEESA